MYTYTYTVAAHKIGNGFSVQYSTPFAGQPLCVCVCVYVYRKKL